MQYVLARRPLRGDCRRHQYTDDRYITTGSTNTAAGEIDGTYDAPAEWYVTLRIKFAGEKAAAPYSPPPTPPAAEPVAPTAAVAPEAQREFQVFFDFDKSDVTDAAAKVIQAAADVVKAGGVAHITVTGHTDTVGTASYNQACRSGVPPRSSVS